MENKETTETVNDQLGKAPAANIEPHSPAANALPNGGASGVAIEANAQNLSRESSNSIELPIGGTEPVEGLEKPLPKNQHPNDVKFKVKYPKDYKGDKNFEDGSIQVVSKESAAQFTKLGIGSIVK